MKHCIVMQWGQVKPQGLRECTECGVWGNRATREEDRTCVSFLGLLEQISTTGVLNKPRFEGWGWVYAGMLLIMRPMCVERMKGWRKNGEEGDNG